MEDLLNLGSAYHSQFLVLRGFVWSKSSRTDSSLFQLTGRSIPLVGQLIIDAPFIENHNHETSSPDFHKNPRRTINHPMLYVSEDIKQLHLTHLITTLWPEELIDFKMKIEILKGILLER